MPIQQSSRLINRTLMMFVIRQGQVIFDHLLMMLFYSCFENIQIFLFLPLLSFNQLISTEFFFSEFLPLTRND